MRTCIKTLLLSLCTTESLAGRQEDKQAYKKGRGALFTRVNSWAYSTHACRVECYTRRTAVASTWFVPCNCKAPWVGSLGLRVGMFRVTEILKRLYLLGDLWSERTWSFGHWNKSWEAIVVVPIRPPAVAHHLALGLYLPKMTPV